MYFSTLKKRIQSLEEKRFYDISLFFLETSGYAECSIIDGTGDGGRDVECKPRPDLRIQLSVRRDWQNKLNEEAKNTFDSKKYHLIYITNRPISDKELADFLDTSYKYKAQVDITLYDLNRISTRLAVPGVIHRAYEQLGLAIPEKLDATPAQIAISSLLLFSSEAKDLRENIIEVHIKSEVYKDPGISEQGVAGKIKDKFKDSIRDHDISRAIGRLRSRKEIEVSGNAISLSAESHLIFSAAEREFSEATRAGREEIVKKYKISAQDAASLISLALEIEAREDSLDGDSVSATQLLSLIANLGLARKKHELYQDLSSLQVAKVKQYGLSLDHILATNTFDIYRSLGQHTKVTMLLDSSVAMPMIFGLQYQSTNTQYGIAANALNKLCRDHNIEMAVPAVYVDEMAHHGILAQEYLETYTSLDDAAKDILRASRNSYLSHFSSLRGMLSTQGFGLQEFLRTFGISPQKKKHLIKNRIESILNFHGIKVIDTGRWDLKMRELIAAQKLSKSSHIVDHDASVSTFLKNTTDQGFILSTWDKVFMEIVEGQSRIYANTPAKIIDYLSMAGGADFEIEQSISLLSSLIHCDEIKLARLANKIQGIKDPNVVAAFNLAVADELRSGSDAPDREDELLKFFDKHSDTHEI